jgi:ABC-type multidrug transport system fused ATPase/permease subunit
MWCFRMRKIHNCSGCLVFKPQLIERFYKVDSGIVTIDGVDINLLDIQWLRENIGFIDQEPVLFSGTVFENIAYGIHDSQQMSESELKDKVYSASSLANAHDFISSFPDGYNTFVGERGVSLSGGQKQRISIARAIASNPKILVLDEATSALDPYSEKAVQDALNSLMKGRTVIIVAHRLSTIANADTIVVMQSIDGCNDGHVLNIVEIGTPKELIAKNGTYAKMLKGL